MEAKVSTSDSAYVKVGQAANVKLDAYDYAIYGTLNGHVVYVSPDTLLDETRQGAVPYYRVHIALEDTVFKGRKASAIQVKPGMTATVEIKASTRTVLSFLVKPIAKTLQESMGERYAQASASGKMLLIAVSSYLAGQGTGMPAAVTAA